MTTLGPSTTPGTYEYQVLDQLHDPNFNRWSQAQIDGYVNEARKQLVMDTGCLRSLQQSYVTPGQEQYTFGQVTGGVILTGGAGYVAPAVGFSGGGGSGVAATVSQSGGAVNAIAFTNFGSGYSSAPAPLVTDGGPGVGATVAVGILNVLTYDVLGVACYQGNQRYSLLWKPFRAFSAWFRPYSAASYQRQPEAWAVYGDNSIFIGPTPDQSYAIEVDSVVLPTPFAVADTTTPDTIPVVAQDPIKFYAAYLAKQNAQSFGEAQTFYDQYLRKLREVTSVYTGRVPDIYSSS